MAYAWKIGFIPYTPSASSGFICRPRSWDTCRLCHVCYTRSNIVIVLLGRPIFDIRHGTALTFVYCFFVHARRIDPLQGGVIFL